MDDNPNILRVLRTNLERTGHRVSTAADGLKALALVENDRPDLVITDLNMPRLDGVELIRRLRQEPRFQAIPVIVLTARGQDEDHLEAIRSGAVYSLHKPVHPAELLEVVQRTLPDGAFPPDSEAASETAPRP